MKQFEDFLYKNDEHMIIGFINSYANLEYSIFECRDSGFIDLENRVKQFNTDFPIS